MYTRYFTLFFLIMLFITSGCCIFHKKDTTTITILEPTPEDPVSIIESYNFNPHGRAFSLDLLNAKIESVDYKILQINGDDVVISFYGSSPPFKPDIQSNSLLFGGHTFTVSNTPNVFSVDGTIHRLDPGIHIFSSGEYRGKIR